MSWQELKDSIAEKAKDLVVLDIETVVKSSEDDGTNVMEITTTIEQITGDIKNTFTESAFKLDYGERLIEFHERQRAAGIAILERNVDVIRSLFKLAQDGIDDKLGKDDE